MDNFRLKITNIDRSQSLLLDDSATTSFTIVDAPKGPQKPYYIPAGKFTQIGEVFGYPDKEYKGLHEVFDVNSGYGVWVSAPYDPATSKIPVAYMTPAGVFRKHTPVTLGVGEYVENIEEDGLSVEGITTFATPPSILVPVGYEEILFDTSVNGDAIATVLEYDVTNKLTINLSFEAETELGDPDNSLFHFLNSSLSSQTGGKIMKAKTANVGAMTFIIPGHDPIDISLKLNGGNLELYTGEDGTGIQIGNFTPADNGATLYITGGTGLSGDYEQFFDSSTLDAIWSNEDFINSVEIYWKAELEDANIVASVFPKYVSERTTKLSFEEADFDNKVKNTVSEAIGAKQASYTFSWSLNPTDTDGFGNSLEVTSKIDAEPLVDIHVFKTFEGLKFTKTNSLIGPSDFQIPSVSLSGGTRGTVANVNDHWDEAMDPEFNEVDIFFAVDTPDNGSTFFSLDDTHTLSRFAFPKHVIKSNVNSSLVKLNYGLNYFATSGMFSRTSTYTRETYTSPLIGAYVKMACDALEKANGGAALMYINDNRGLGGQLDVSVKKSLVDYKYSDAELKLLNDRNYNPIVLSPYGIMVTSHKTCKGGEISDWSFIGHTSAFLDFQKEVRKLVMIPQIGKANNDYYRELRSTQVEDLLRKRTEGSERIWASGTVDTSTTNVNTDDVLAARQFKMVVTVKVDIFSEGVELQFISEGQV